MSAIISFLFGMAMIRIKGLMTESFLNSCSSAGIELASVRRIDHFTIELKIPFSDIKEAKKIAMSCFCDFESVKSGREWLYAIRRKVIPIIIIFLLIAVVFWSKFYVWEIELKGNENVSDGEILSVLAQCGVENGAFWPAFSADNIRSEVLYSIPELSWITVNMHGSLAEVIVVERKRPPEMAYKNECSSIVADKDGFIVEVNAFEGKSLVKSGDAVKKGEVLISGIVESSYAPPRFLNSLGTVKAETNNAFIAVRASTIQKKSATGKIRAKYALIIGNKRINFYSGSSISEDFCDKIISVWSPEIKGILKLPVSIVRECSFSYSGEYCEADYQAASRVLEYSLRENFSREINGGEIIGEKLSVGKSNGLIISTLRVRCIEEIGLSAAVSEEEIANSLYKFSQKADDE